MTAPRTPSEILDAAGDRSVDEAVSECYQGYQASAAKRGRNPRWPYVPIVMRPRNDIGRPDLFTTEQIRTVAFETREQAVDYSEKTIRLWRETFRKQLLTPSYRPLRAQWGVSDAAALAREAGE